MNRLAIALLLAASIGLPAHAQIYLGIDDIPGESLADGHQGEIDILSWGQSVANLNNMPVVLPLVVTHRIDKATPKLIEAAILGRDLGLATLAVSSTGPTPFDYIVLELNGAKVVSVNSGGAEGTAPVETVTLTCATFELRYREVMQDGSAGPIVQVNGSCGSGSQ